MEKSGKGIGGFQDLGWLVLRRVFRVRKPVDDVTVLDWLAQQGMGHEVSLDEQAVSLDKLFSWFTVLFCRSRCLLEQAASLFLLGLRKVCLVLGLINMGTGN